MSETPKYTKVTTYQELPDGTWKKKTEGYHERLASIKEERVENVATSRESFLNDLMQAIRVISEGKTKDLVLEIKAREFAKPSMIIKTYTTYKEEFKKR